MNRSTLIFGSVIALVVIWMATLVVTRPVGLTEGEVRALVSELVTDEVSLTTAAVDGVDASSIHPMIESYLMANPRLLERMSAALKVEVEAETAAQTKFALADIQEQIYNDPSHVVLGNPNGDVTLVELFDYNCGYCRQALPDMATLLAEDPNLKIILKEFPILSQESVDAARVAVAVTQAGGDYWAFHETLFTARGQVTGLAALDAVRAMGMNPIAIELVSEGEEVTQVIQRSYDIAQSLGISGTPAYIIGNEVIPGAVGLQALKARIANMRACGETKCS